MRSVLVLVLALMLTLTNAGVVKRSVDEDLKTLRTMVELQAASISSLQSTVLSHQASITSGLAIVDNHEAELSNQLAKITALESKVQTLSKPVAFTAMFSNDDSDGIPLTDYQILKFDRVVTNGGNGYNSSTGIFTAPLAGYYAFSVVAMEPNGASHVYLSLAVVKNGKVVDELWVTHTQSGQDEQGSTHSVLHLAAGDKVWIRQEGYGDAVRGSYWTVFTGYLVHAE